MGVEGDIAVPFDEKSVSWQKEGRVEGDAYL